MAGAYFGSPHADAFRCGRVVSVADRQVLPGRLWSRAPGTALLLLDTAARLPPRHALSSSSSAEELDLSRTAAGLSFSPAAARLAAQRGAGRRQRRRDRDVAGH